jgi:hypothetical protein
MPEVARVFQGCQGCQGTPEGARVAGGRQGCQGMLGYAGGRQGTPCSTLSTACIRSNHTGNNRTDRSTRIPRIRRNNSTFHYAFYSSST